MNISESVEKESSVGCFTNRGIKPRSLFPGLSPFSRLNLLQRSVRPDSHSLSSHIGQPQARSMQGFSAKFRSFLKLMWGT